MTRPTTPIPSPGDPAYGAWVKHRREELNFATQTALAEALACDPDVIQKIESAVRRPTPERAIELGRILQVPDVLFARYLNWAKGTDLPPPGLFTPERVPPALLPPGPEQLAAELTAQLLPALTPLVQDAVAQAQAQDQAASAAERAALVAELEARLHATLADTVRQAVAASLDGDDPRAPRAAAFLTDLDTRLAGYTGALEERLLYAYAADRRLAQEELEELTAQQEAHLLQALADERARIEALHQGHLTLLDLRDQGKWAWRWAIVWAITTGLAGVLNWPVLERGSSVLWLPYLLLLGMILYAGWNWVRLKVHEGRPRWWAIAQLIGLALVISTIVTWCGVGTLTALAGLPAQIAAPFLTAVPTPQRP